MSIPSSFSPVFVKSGCSPSPTTVIGVTLARVAFVSSQVGRGTPNKEVARAEELVSKFAKYTQEEEMMTKEGVLVANKVNKMMQKFDAYTLEEELSVEERNAYNTSPRMRGSYKEI